MAPTWPSVAPAWPCFTYAPRVALLHLPCFLSWRCVAFRGPAWPCFTYFASCHGLRDREPRVALLHLPAWHSVAPALLPVMTPLWPCLLWPPCGLASCLGPCVSFHRMALLRLLCFLSWPLRGMPWPPRGLASPTLLPVVALLCLLCFLSWPLRGLPWPPRGLASPTLLPVMAPAWPSVAPAWPCFTYLAFCHGACVAFRGPAWPCFTTLLPVMVRVTVNPAWPCFTYRRGIPWPPRCFLS